MPIDSWGMLRGDVVNCNLMVGWEHSGIYVGRGKIIHLVNEPNQYGKLGRIVKSGVGEFLNRFAGLNPAWSVYVACEANGDHVGLPFYAIQAESLRQRHRGYGYDLIFKNCHQFTSKCIGRLVNGCTYWKGMLANMIDGNENMIEFVSNREIYERVIRDAVPKSRQRLWIATADIKDMYVETGGRDMDPFLKVLAQLIGRNVEISVATRSCNIGP